MINFRNYFAALLLSALWQGRLKAFQEFMRFSWAFTASSAYTGVNFMEIWKCLTRHFKTADFPSFQLIKMHYWVHELCFNLALKAELLIDFHSGAEFSFSTFSHRFELASLFITLSVHNDLLICFSHIFSLDLYPSKDWRRWEFIPYFVYFGEFCVHKLMR